MVSIILSACGTAPARPMKQKSDSDVDLSGKVESLQKQLRERNKRIEELESQLEALKQIDQDHEREMKPLQPPAARMPAK